VKDPTRNLPRALTYGLLAVLAIYLTVNLAYFVALPIDQIAGTDRIAEAAAAALVGPMGATLVATTVVVSTFGCNAAAILAGSRLLYGMAADGLFFKVTAAVHPRYRSPHVAVAGITIWSAFLALSGSYQQLFTYVVFTSVLFSLFGGLALFRLRIAQPGTPRPYRVWGFPVVPGIFVLGSVVVVINTLMTSPRESMAGLSLLALGLPAYWYWRKGKT
jgi:APA family basic amino acid/polyamine antiporter